jgi:hypothetical protein
MAGMGFLNKAAVVICVPILLGVVATNTDIGARAVKAAQPYFAPVTERLNTALDAGVKAGEQQSRTMLGKDLAVALEKDPMYAALKEVDPATAAALLATAQKAVEDGDTIELATADVQRDFADATLRYVPNASTDALLKLSNEQIRLGAKAAEKDPLLCYGFFYPTDSGVTNNQQFMSAEDMVALGNTKGAVIRTGAKTPTQISDREAAQTSLNLVLTDLGTKYGADLQLLSKPQTPDIDKGKLCAITLDFLRAVVNLTPEQAADVIRLTTGNTSGNTVAQNGQNAATATPQPTAVPTLPPVTDEEIREADAELLKDPIFQAIAVADKDRYRTLATEFAVGRKNGNTDAVFVNGNATGVELTQRLAPVASDQTLINFSRAATDVADRLSAVDAPACLAALSGQAVDPALTEPFKRESQRLKTSTAEAIKSGAQQPAPPFDAAKGDTLMAKVRERLPAEVNDVLGQGERAEPAARCKAKVALYRQVFRLSRPDAAVVLRMLFGKP